VKVRIIDNSRLKAVQIPYLFSYLQIKYHRASEYVYVQFAGKMQFFDNDITKTCTLESGDAEDWV
jgi:hypothetical protein